MSNAERVGLREMAIKWLRDQAETQCFTNDFRPSHVDSLVKLLAEASQRSEKAGALWKRADELIVKLTAHCAGIDLPDEEEHRKAVEIIMDALEGK